MMQNAASMRPALTCRAQVAEVLQDRTAKQCRERWVNHLDPSINKSKWTAEEKAILLGPGPPGRLRGLGVSHRESLLYGVFVWTRRAPNGLKRRFRPLGRGEQEQ
jgi:hypothetical protein